jgi:hypothetical protein
MAESAEKRKARHERYKQKLAENPEARAEYVARSKAAKDRYEAKKKLARAMTRSGNGPVGSGKPGRLVALCGWHGW